MKKTLSLILAIILTFSMSTLAFAGEAVALTKDEAKAKAVEHINYDSEVSLATYALSGTFNDDIQGTVEVYNVTSTLVLKTGRTVTYYTVVDKYNGKIYYQKATIMDLPSLFDLTEETAGQFISFDAYIDSANSSSKGYVYVSEELGNTGTEIFNTKGNNVTSNSLYYLEKGKVYYIYFKYNFFVHIDIYISYIVIIIITSINPVIIIVCSSVLICI